MILKGSQRGQAGKLADHLLNIADNDHITVKEVRGFMARDLKGAFEEAHAISRATQCRQYLFSLSFNPPKDGQARIEDFLNAIERAEEALGLKGQPRAIVIHEKEGRRHAHAVWSRIDADKMTAINMPFFKQRLANLSRELYLDHGWVLPEGHRENGWKNPLNFSLAEWQQAKRIDLDPREIKQVFQEAWKQADGLKAFTAALEQCGYYVAKGDRRGMVAVDIHGEVYSLSRWAGVKTKELKERFGEPDKLPTVAETHAAIRQKLSANIRSYIKESREQQQEERAPLIEARQEMVTAHRAERVKLERGQKARLEAETKARAARIRTGLRGVVDFISGRRRELRAQNEAEAYQGLLRDRAQREAMFTAQMRERKALQQRFDQLRQAQRDERLALVRRVASVMRRQDGNNQSQSQDTARGHRLPSYTLDR